VKRAQAAEVEAPTGPVRLNLKVASIDPSELNFSENGMPFIKKGDMKFGIDEVKITAKPGKEIKSLTITDKRPGQSAQVRDEAKLAVANTIKRIADAVAPQYTDYLLRLARYEGNFDAQAVNDNGAKGIDRGVFQINNKSFPQITDAQANDPEFATLWAISVINAGKQSKWFANPIAKKAKLKINY
jgi:hypothetical protein